jgi:hypothetical protein
LAEQHGFYVLYLLQPASANANKCWNWFLPAHQKRAAGMEEVKGDERRIAMWKYYYLELCSFTFVVVGFILLVFISLLLDCIVF